MLTQNFQCNGSNLGFCQVQATKGPPSMRPKIQQRLIRRAQ